jgi:hypothetical protein
MKSVLTGAACLGIAIFSSVPLLAQVRDNSERQLTCSSGGNDGDRARHCELKEFTAAAIGRLNIDSSKNGGISVKGWSRGDVLVRARIDAQADTTGAAAILVSRVLVDASGGQVRAIGPETTDNSWWSVSYEIFVPHNMDLALKSVNGGLNVSDVRGRLSFEGVNGGVHMKRVAGEISGRTVNGGIDVELVGSAADARQMDLTTTNGGVTVTVPQDFSARVQTETNMGRVTSDFPLPADLTSGNQRGRKMDFSIGAGGPPMHITTSNGGIRIKRAETR